MSARAVSIEVIKVAFYPVINIRKEYSTGIEKAEFRELVEAPGLCQPLPLFALRRSAPTVSHNS